MTEDEAKKKWCPFARVADDDGATFNRTWVGEIHGATVCLGSACMAWEWDEAAYNRAVERYEEGTRFASAEVTNREPDPEKFFYCRALSKGGEP